MSVAETISFSNFCQLCSRIKNASQDKKFFILQHYICNWNKKGKDLKDKQNDIDDSFFPVFRLLLPHLDRERGAYGIKERTLSKIYISILSLPKEGADAKKLLNYRAPNAVGCEAYDFADIAFLILKNRCTEGGELSIEEINKHLSGIAASHASNEQRNVHSELISLLKSTSAEEQKWLIRILLKEVKLGIGENAIFKCYHPDAKDLYDSNNNLRKVCDLLKNPKIRLNEIEIQLFTPFKPMLSEECDVLKIDSYIKKSPYFYIETKLDGERFQLHMKEGSYKYFSRNGYDFTSNFGSTLHDGTLTPRIINQFHPEVRSCILDGEMMSWNSKTQSFSSKGKNIDVKNLKESNTHQPCFCVFDVLFYNNEVLTNKPLNMRLEILKKIISPLEGGITFLNRKKICTSTEVIDLLNEAIDRHEEGIVMKEFMSVYKPNVRKNGGWYKIKPEYTDSLADTLDLLIIGGYHGNGRYKGMISHFLLGVALSSNENDQIFYSTGRVGSGYSIKELENLLIKLQPHWKPTVKGETPSNVQWSKEKPDVWIEPSKSFLLEVKAAEIISSNMFKTGYTLRFPRVEKIRYDKSWKDCLTLEELKEKIKVASGKLAATHFDLTPNQSFLPKKKSRVSSQKTLHEENELWNVNNISSLLADKEICVFSGFQSISKHAIEKKVIEFGGTLVKNPGKNTFCVLAEEDNTARIKNLIKCGSHDIIYSSWFLSILKIENRQLPPLKPENFLAMSNRTQEVFAKSYDEFGDHYTVPSTLDTIKYSMMVSKKKMKNFFLSVDKMDEIDVELFGGLSPYSIFRNCIAYFDEFEILSEPDSGFSRNLEIFKVDFRFYGGKCLNCISDDVTHVIVFSENLSRLNKIHEINRNRKAKFHVFTEKWIQSSINNKALISDFNMLNDNN